MSGSPDTVFIDYFLELTREFFMDPLTLAGFGVAYGATALARWYLGKRWKKSGYKRGLEILEAVEAVSAFPLAVAELFLPTTSRKNPVKVAKAIVKLAQGATNEERPPAPPEG